jgi:hypothetical protein
MVAKYVGEEMKLEHFCDTGHDNSWEIEISKVDAEKILYKVRGHQL